MRNFLLSLFSFITASAVTTVRAVEALPDMVPIADVAKNYVNGWQLDRTTQAGKTLLRLSTAMGNAGTGPLEIWGGSTSGSSQQVYQRIYDSNGTSRDRLAGSFIYHPEHGHVHFNGFAIYNLRRVGPGNTVGDIIAAGQKTSFCLINIDQYWPTLTTSALVRSGRGGSSCGKIQGISPGYADVYGRTLPDQWIDVTSVPSGTYWLEVIADPDNYLLETNETNNVVRIQLNYTNPAPPPSNNAPTVTAPVAQSTTRGDSVNLQVNATDVDGQIITYSALALPLGLNINAATGLISGNVNVNALPSYTTQIIVSDGQLQSSVSFTWNTVAPLNGAGLLGEYYTGVNFGTFAWSRVDSAVNFDWTSAGPYQTTPGVGAPGIANYSVRWRGRAVPQYTQTYTFSVNADDGARLWVNDQLIINRWNSTAGETSGSIALTAGQEASIKLEYFQTTGPGTVALSWASPSQGKQVIPTHRLFPASPNRAPTIFNPGNQPGAVGNLVNLAINATDADGNPLTYSATNLPTGLSISSATGGISGTFTEEGIFVSTITATDGQLSSAVTFSWNVGTAEVGTGLHGTYYTGREFNTEIGHRTDALINFDWGWQNIQPMTGTGIDDFSIRWTGEVLPQYSETYTFTVAADNGCKLWVNDSLLVSNWNSAGGEDSGTYSGTVVLQAGVRASLRLEYYEAYGGARVNLSWASVSQPNQLVPTDRMFPVEDHHSTDYIRPTVVLSTPSYNLQGPFQVAVNFSEAVTGLTVSDFLLSAGSITSLTGSGRTYTLQITPPTVTSSFSLYLPESRTQDAAENTNQQSNILSLNYAANVPPAFPAAIPAQTSIRGTNVSLAFTAQDTDGVVTGYSATNLPAGLAIHPTSGVISGTIAANALASYSSTITATDNRGGTDTEAFTWNITNPATNPLPTVKLILLRKGIYAPNVVRVEFSEPVTGLELADFASRALPAPVFSDLAGSGASYTLKVLGSATIYLPAGRTLDAAGAGNAESTDLAVTNSSIATAPANTAVVAHPGDQQSSVGQTISLAMTKEFSNTTGTWSATGLPAGLGINATSGIVSGIVSSAATTRNNVTVTFGSSSKTFLWTVVTPTGLIGDYFTGLNLNTRVHSRMDQTINFEWQGGSPHSTLPVDNYSVRWTGELTPDYTEEYTFVANSDNGLRLWVNNVKVIDVYDTATSPGGTFLGTVKLTAGVKVPIRMEFFEASGWATATLIWYSPRQGWEVVPASKLSPAGTNWAPTISSPGNLTSRLNTAVDIAIPASDVDASDVVCLAAASLPPGLYLDPTDNRVKGTPNAVGVFNVTLLASDGKAVTSAPIQWTIAPPASGLTAKYYAGRNFDTLLTERVDPNINFYWSTAAAVASGPVDNFSVRWTGCVIPAFTETYTFYARCDDGVRLWINGQLLIDTWAVPTTAERSASISLAANQPATVKMEYFEATSYARAELSWSSASTPKAIIPNARLMINESSLAAAITPAQEADSPNSRAAVLAAAQDIAGLQRSLRIASVPNNQADVMVVVPSGLDHAVRYQLQGSASLQGWQDLPNTPIASPRADGTTELRFPNARNQPSVNGPAAFFRVRTQLLGN